jgi:hypothetical protein
MSKATNSIKDEQIRNTFKYEITKFAGAWSKECFDKVVPLFTAKWLAIPDAKVATEHFQKVWLSERLCRFYRGAAQGNVMNNNGLEATNKVLKDRATLRELLPILHLLPAVKKWLEEQSSYRNPANVNFIPFAPDAPVMLLKDFTEGYNEVRLKQKIFHIEDHYISVSPKNGGIFDRAAAVRILAKYRTNDFASIEEYKSFISFVVVVNPEMQCNCHKYSKCFKCMHVTAIQIRLGQVVVPDNAKTVPVASKRKPGRPAQIGGRYDRPNPFQLLPAQAVVAIVPVVQDGHHEEEDVFPPEDEEGGADNDVYDDPPIAAEQSDEENDYDYDYDYDDYNENFDDEA